MIKTLHRNCRPAGGLQAGGLRQSGIGLIELMVSLLIGLLVMAGVVQLFSTTGQNAIAAAGSSRIQENVRYAFTRFAQDIAQSGNLGCINSSLHQSVANAGDADNDADDTTLVENLLGMEAGVNELHDFGTIVNGVENASENTPPAGKVAPGTDTFFVRFANNAANIQITDSTTTTITVDNASTLEKGQVVLAADCTGGAIFVITKVEGDVISHTTEDVGNLSNAKAERSYEFPSVTTESPDSIGYLYANTTGAYQYFIGTSVAARNNGECDPGDEDTWQNCALYVRDEGQNLELIEGVHNMQLRYGWNTDKDGLFFTDAGGVGVDDWDLIDRVEVTLEFNSIDKAVASGNNLDRLITKSVTRVFNLYNQLEPQ